jgi:hypothetical protein
MCTKRLCALGDTAYSEKQNIIYAKEHSIQLIAKLNPSKKNQKSAIKLKPKIAS